MRKGPETSGAEIAVITSSAIERMRLAEASSISPSVVSLTLRLVRSNSRAPTRSSSLAIWALTADCVREIFFAEGA